MYIYDEVNILYLQRVREFNIFLFVICPVRPRAVYIHIAFTLPVYIINSE